VFTCRIVFFLWLLLLWPWSAIAAEKVSVTVSGVNKEIKANVLALLTIYRQKDNERLQAPGVRRLHRKAEKDIQAALAPFGYYHPIVHATLKKKDDVWHADYSIEPGPPVLIAEVRTRLISHGSENTGLQEAMQELKLKKGAILNQGVYEDEKKRLVRVALAAGYLDAVFVEKAITIDRLTNTAVISLVLDTGPMYVFGETTSNQEIIAKSLLDRYLPYGLGQPYSPKKLFELQSILYRTDYFRRVVVHGNIDQAEDNAIPVEIELVPPEHFNRYSLGAGYATDTGLRGKAEWTNRLVNKYGHRMSTVLQLAELENILTIRYEIPREDPRYDSMINNLSYQDKTWEDTTTRLLSASISTAHAGPRFKLNSGLELRDEVYDVGDTSGDSTLLIPSVNCGIVFADDILQTRNGIQASIGVLGGVDGVISDVNFLQSTISGKAIITPLDGWRLIGRGNIGVTFVDSIDSLPPSLRFYTGGDTTIRGYAYKSIGTRDSAGEVIGGRYLMVGSIELERHIKKQWSVATFWDGGTATDDLSLNFYQGVGLGIRFRLPFGQVRLDVASAVTEDGNPFRVHFSVGGDL
jgi:translocation and assembly module TamA